MQAINCAIIMPGCSFPVLNVEHSLHWAQPCADTGIQRNRTSEAGKLQIGLQILKLLINAAILHLLLLNSL